ncbi:MAG TPA: hypothetical protein VHZ95_22210, partial [Polyangiales bacterium]|nr:hypothetical protein [Polyangiales bacterium]
SGVFFRREVARASGTAERQLIDDLEKSLDPKRVAEELGRCQRQDGPLACAYVTRTVYRFMNTFAERDTLARVAALFDHSPSALYDRSLLGARKHGDWHIDVVAFARSL